MAFRMTDRNPIQKPMSLQPIDIMDMFTTYSLAMKENKIRQRNDIKLKCEFFSPRKMSLIIL